MIMSVHFRRLFFILVIGYCSNPDILAGIQPRSRVPIVLYNKGRKEVLFLMYIAGHILERLSRESRELVWQYRGGQL